MERVVSPSGSSNSHSWRNNGTVIHLFQPGTERRSTNAPRASPRGELIIKFCRGKIIPSSKISWTSNLSFSLPWEEASWKELSTGVAFDSRRRFPPPIKTSLAHNLALCRVIQPHPERNHRAATPQHEKRGRGATINANSLDIGTMPAVVPSFINPRTSRATTQSTECNRDFASLKREREKKRKGTTSRLELELELCSR